MRVMLIIKGDPCRGEYQVDRQPGAASQYTAT
jgi:hypothetical protein